MGWNTLPQDSEILAIHAALLHTGHILYFGGDEHDKGHHDANQIDATRLFDCATLQVSTVPSPTTDVFCAGHAFLADGRLLVAGGTEAFPLEVGTLHHDQFTGLRDAWIFDPATRTWTHVASMMPEPGHEAQNTGGGRWYPSLVTLPDGKILALSGKTSSTDTRIMNDCCESFNPKPLPAGKWKFACKEHDEAADHDMMMPLYPRLHVLPNGDVFCSDALPQNQPGNRNKAFSPAKRKWSDVCAGLADLAYDDIITTSVLLPLLPEERYRARILRSGSEQPMRLDLGVAPPVWNPTGVRPLGLRKRRHGSAVLLPTGNVFVCGGVSNDDNSDASAVKEAELYVSATNQWQTLEAASIVRNYHSVALLMPDGRVWTAGSSKNAKQSFVPPGNRELTIELYSPPYMSASRPQILTAPTTARWNQRFVIQTPQANTIQRVAAIRQGSMTHAFNYDQRYVGLEFQVTGAQELRVKAPPNARLAPPGWYLLFLLDNQGVPSVGWFMRIGKTHP